jgi:hypothetical protein
MYPDDSIQGILSPNLKLPVAALPQYKKEVKAVYRAKKRPGLIVCSGGTKIDRILTAGKPNWQTSRTVIVAPYYGADEGGKRSGFRPEFAKVLIIHTEHDFYIDRTYKKMSLCSFILIFAIFMQ